MKLILTAGILASTSTIFHDRADDHRGGVGMLEGFSRCAILDNVNLKARAAVSGRFSNGPRTAEEEAEFEKQVIAKAKEIQAEKSKRDKEIDAFVAQAIKRDKRDFTELANQFKEEDRTPAEFAVAMLQSDKFKASAVVGSGPQPNAGKGSGIEVNGIRGIPIGSPGEIFLASEGYRAWRDQSHSGSTPDRKIRCTANAPGMLQVLSSLGVKFDNYTPTTESGLTSIEKLPGVVTIGVRPLRVKDLIAPGATNNTDVRYIQENSFTNDATVVAETGTLPEQTFSLSEVDAYVADIGAFTKMTKDMMEDYLQVASYINMRLPYAVERTEEDQLLNGTGGSTGPNQSTGITGILQTSGILTQALGSDNIPDAIYKAMTNVRWGSGIATAGVNTAQGGYEPDAIIMHPTDWQKLRLSKDNEGQYFAGGPFTGAYGNGNGYVQYESIWGKPVCVTPAIAQGTALVGAFKIASQYFQRQGMEIESTNSDGTDFQTRLYTLRATIRLALAVYRPAGFCQVTGITYP